MVKIERKRIDKNTKAPKKKPIKKSDKRIELSWSDQGELNDCQTTEETQDSCWTGQHHHSRNAKSTS